MSWRKANSPGWASFDLKQRQQRDGSAFVETFNHINEEEKPSFPPICRTDTVQKKKKNHLIPPTKSFSSVLLPTADMEFPALRDENNNIYYTQGPSAATSSSTSTTESDTSEASKILIEIYSWADKSLITDVLVAVGDDINKASALLAEMVCSDSTEQKKDNSIQMSNFNAFLSKHKCSDVNKGTSFKVSADIEELNCLKEGGLSYANGELNYEKVSCRDEDSDNAAALNKLGLTHWKNVPVEPEWEEDDIYFIHREEALHMMRSASQHSRKAADAYMRGDHFSAQKLSAKARQEWAAVERLNAKAAKEILSLRNNDNGPWKLDLHGLHALEAVQALQERLQKLEPLVPSDRSLSPNRRNSNKTTGGGIVRCSSLESLTCNGISGTTSGTGNFNGKYCESSSLQQRGQTSLHVITGIGNHSRGEAALPAAVKNFLNENGYRYDDARPGLIIVRPKFRQKRVLEELVACALHNQKGSSTRQKSSIDTLDYRRKR